MLAPAGLYYCYKKANDGMIFAAIYVVLAVYFAGFFFLLFVNKFRSNGETVISFGTCCLCNGGNWTFLNNKIFEKIL